jgi:hypothetical protein
MQKSEHRLRKLNRRYYCSQQFKSVPWRADPAPSWQSPPRGGFRWVLAPRWPPCTHRRWFPPGMTVHYAFKGFCSKVLLIFLLYFSTVKSYKSLVQKTLIETHKTASFETVFVISNLSGFFSKQIIPM